MYFIHALFCRLFSIFPIDKKKIHVSCWNGRGGFSCNAKYIIQELEHRFPRSYKIYWAVNDDEILHASFPDYINLVRFHSLTSLYHQMTSFLWIDNCRKDMPYKRKGQYYLQTWHGSGPLKKVEADVREALVTGYEYNAKKDSAVIDGFLSGSRVDSGIFRHAFWYAGHVLDFGLPRTDILFKNDNTELKAEFCRKYNIDPSVRFVLYAPTFRDKKKGKEFDYGMKIEPVLESLRRKFGGEWKFLLRFHKNNEITEDDMRSHPDCIDVTSYIDMQELLCIADAAIDDYSSWVYDFMYTERPCFIYAPDISDYYDIRGFYIDFYSLPFPISENMDELCKDILSYDEKFRIQKSRDLLSRIGTFNDGHASERTVDWIMKLK